MINNAHRAEEDDDIIKTMQGIIDGQVEKNVKILELTTTALNNMETLTKEISLIIEQFQSIYGHVKKHANMFLSINDRLQRIIENEKRVREKITKEFNEYKRTNHVRNIILGGAKRRKKYNNHYKQNNHKNNNSYYHPHNGRFLLSRKKTNRHVKKNPSNSRKKKIDLLID